MTSRPSTVSTLPAGEGPTYTNPFTFPSPPLHPQKEGVEDLHGSMNGSTAGAAMMGLNNSAQNATSRNLVIVSPKGLGLSTSNGAMGAGSPTTAPGGCMGSAVDTCCVKCCPVGVRRMARKFHIPLKVLLTISMCLFTVIPALLLWYLSWKTGYNGLNSMQEMSAKSVEDVSLQLRYTLADNVRLSLVDLFSGAEAVLNFTSRSMRGDGVLAVDGNSLFTSFDVLNRYSLQSLRMILTNDWMSGLQIRQLTNTTVTGSTTKSIVQSLIYSRVYSLPTFDQERAMIYSGRVTTVMPNRTSQAAYSMVNPRNESQMIPLFSYVTPLSTTTFDVSVAPYCRWAQDIEFSTHTALPLLPLSCLLKTYDQQASFVITVQTNTYTISAFLRSLLTGTKERLFVCFDSAAGTLVGASHGKFFSHSDMVLDMVNSGDMSAVVATFKKYAAFNSTDVTIFEAGMWIWTTFGRWVRLPEVSTVQKFVGEDYWVQSRHLHLPLDLGLNVYLLIDRLSRMGPVERIRSETLDDISRTNTHLTIILAIVVFVAFVFALGMSYVLTQALQQLASGMDTLAVLKFRDDRKYTLSNHSTFSEVHQCEGSFVALERGIRAFIKYVPREIVRMMLSGEMESEIGMARQVASMLFMDLVGFSAICERIRADQLITLTTQYLQAMCEIIVAHEGVLDKFIGDCIMAMWNVPRRNARHARCACEAILQMQSRLLGMCDRWIAEGLPELRFRCGINTGRVFVGNYGCDFRISYTCLGDGVNLASRLESSNKRFGTVAIVSESTRNEVGESSDFLFRYLGRICVPGKAEVLSVYEPIFLFSGGESTGATSPVRGSAANPISAVTTSRTDLLPSSGSATDDVALKPFPVNMSGLGSSGVALASVPSPDSPRGLTKLHSSTGESMAEPLTGRANMSSDVLSYPSLVREAPPQLPDTILFHWRYEPLNQVQEMIQLYEKALDYYAKEQLNAAEKLFSKALQCIPDDGASKLMATLCVEHTKPVIPASGSPGPTSPRNHKWDGVVRLNHK